MELCVVLQEEIITLFIGTESLFCPMAFCRAHAPFSADSALKVESCAGREAVGLRVQECALLAHGINWVVAERLS